MPIRNSTNVIFKGCVNIGSKSLRILNGGPHEPSTKQSEERENYWSGSCLANWHWQLKARHSHHIHKDTSVRSSMSFIFWLNTS